MLHAYAQAQYTLYHKLCYITYQNVKLVGDRIDVDTVDEFDLKCGASFIYVHYRIHRMDDLIL